MNNAAADPIDESPGEGSVGRRVWRGFSTAFVFTAFAVLAWRQLRFVGAHAVNMMYGDQWDFYQPMFQGKGWWETFTHQHGPHREGLGLVATRVLAGLSGWDSRWDAFAASALLIAAAVLGLRLALCFGIRRDSLLLLAPPLLFLNVHQYETLVGAVNLSHGAMPVALFMACCLCWFAAGNFWRLMAIGSLTFLLIFTGFGLFVGFLSPVLVTLEGIQAWRRREGAHSAAAAGSLAIILAGWALFARGYTFQPAVAGFRFPYERPLEYGVFVGRMLGNFYGMAVLSTGELVVGLIVAALLAAIIIGNAIRCLRGGVRADPRAAVLFCLSGFALLFCANCAIGRVFTGPTAPLAPRYVTLMIPAGMALFLQMAEFHPGRRFTFLALAYTAVLVPSTAFLRPYEAWGADWYANGRRSWRAAYIETHDKAQADEKAHFPIYPGSLGDRLDFLEANRLNLFLPSPHP